MIRKFTIFIYFFIASYLVFSKGSAGDKAIYETRYIVEMPTAGVIPKGTFSFVGEIFNNGGILGDFSVSPFENFNIGLSFSGIGIIGDETPKFQNLPGISVKFRIFNETTYFPAILIGVNTQGRGEWLSDLKRFETHSPGVFISSSKSFSWKLGYLAIHLGIGYSFEDVKIPNLWLGIEQSLGSIFSLDIEYNANLDEETGIVMKRKGLLNVSLRSSILKGLTLELKIKDLLENSKLRKGFLRIISLELIQSF